MRIRNRSTRRIRIASLGIFLRQPICLYVASPLALIAGGFIVVYLKRTNDKKTNDKTLCLKNSSFIEARLSVFSEKNPSEKIGEKGWKKRGKRLDRTLSG